VEEAKMKGSLKKRGQYWYLKVDMGNQQIGVDDEGKPIYNRIQKRINNKCEKKKRGQTCKI
jgi:hypothetical protein